MDVDLRAWPITPTATQRAEHGLNNDTFFVTAREGEFVARVYRNTADPARVRYEHELLGRLRTQDVPFVVPSPVRTRAGDTIAVLEGTEGPRLAALFERIPGEPATLDPQSAGRVGRALALLDAALARVDLPIREPIALRDVHLLVPDPIRALDDLELADAFAEAGAALERVTASREALAASLPLQIIHGDFGFTNTLVEQGKVTGIVDFEFAEPDVRAADLAGALYQTALRAPDSARWPTIEALAKGYRSALPLDPVEIAALPDLMLRRSAFSLVHWIGRWRQGIAPKEEASARAARLVRFTRWLDTNAPRIALVAAGEKLPGPRERSR